MRLRHYASPIAVFAVAALVGSAQSQTRSAGNKWALLVGIDEYEHDITPLAFAVADVKAVSQALVTRLGFAADNVKVMTSDVSGGIDRPTRLNVIRRLNGMANLIKPQDTFFFYFSGHGFQKDNKHFLATVEAVRDSIDLLENSTVSLETLRKSMSRITAHRIIFVIDACRNDPDKGKSEGDNLLTGDFARDLQVVAKSAGGGVAGTGLLFACSVGERAYEWKEKGQGAFTYYLLEGMAGKAADANGELTLNGLGDYVQKNVLRWSVERSKKQTPDFLQLGAAKVVLPIASNQPTLRSSSPASKPPANSS